jgi:hypothetical protein
MELISFSTNSKHITLSAMQSVALDTCFEIQIGYSHQDMEIKHIYLILASSDARNL